LPRQVVECIKKINLLCAAISVAKSVIHTRC
jgi:hypothetical protein